MWKAELEWAGSSRYATSWTPEVEFPEKINSYEFDRTQRSPEIKEIRILFVRYFLTKEMRGICSCRDTCPPRRQIWCSGDI